MINKIDFNGKVWFEGSFDEWIFAWSKDEKVLLVTYANGDFDNIIGRLVEDKGETYSTKAEKIAYNVNFNEIENAVRLLAEADSMYDTIRLDFSNKKDVFSLTRDCNM